MGMIESIIEMKAKMLEQGIKPGELHMTKNQFDRLREEAGWLMPDIRQDKKLTIDGIKIVIY